MTKQEYRKSLETKNITELRKLAKVASYGTVVHTSGMSRLSLIGFLVFMKFPPEEQ